MIRIGICGGFGGDVIPVSPKEPWMKDIRKKYINPTVMGIKKKGYLFEEALRVALEYNYKNTEVTYYDKTFNETDLATNDINFLVGINLLNAWEKSKAEYNRWYKIMENPKINIYPSLQEQFFLYK